MAAGLHPACTPHPGSAAAKFSGADDCQTHYRCARRPVQPATPTSRKQTVKKKNVGGSGACPLTSRCRLSRLPTPACYADTLRSRHAAATPHAPIPLRPVRATRRRAQRRVPRRHSNAVHYAPQWPRTATAIPARTQQAARDTRENTPSVVAMI